MTRPTPDPPLRGRAVEYALGLTVLADELEQAASAWRTLAGDAVGRRTTDIELSRLRAAADRLDTIAIELAALSAAAGVTLLRRGQLAARLRLAARNALTPDGDRLPAAPAVIADAAEEVRRVADALLDPSPAPPQTPAARPCRVEVTATRLTLMPPCCPAAPIVLARDTVDPLTLNRLDCLACGRVYDVAALGSPDDGLWVSWREQT